MWGQLLYFDRLRFAQKSYSRGAKAAPLAQIGDGVLRLWLDTRKTHCCLR